MSPGSQTRPTATPTATRPMTLYAATLIGLLGAAEAGISTVVDWCEVNTDNAHMDAALQAHADSGMRTVCAYADTGSNGDVGGVGTRAATLGHDSRSRPRLLGR